MSPPMWILMVSGGLLALSGGILFRVLTAHRHPEATIYARTPGTLGWSQSLAWTIPAVVAFAWVTFRAMPLFEYPVQEKAETPSGLDITLEEPEGVTVDKKDAKGESSGEDETTANLPSWVGQPPRTDGDVTLFSLSTKEQPTQADAEKELQALALARVRADFDREFPSTVEWTVPAGAVKFNFAHEEKIPRKAGNVSFTMIRLHRELEISPETRKVAFAAWRQAVVAQRLRGMAGVGGTLVLIVFASAAYLRIDAKTRGQYRTQLKTAAVATIVAGSLIAGSLV